MPKKILLIDDDVDDRELFTEAIGVIDPEIICATIANGRKALDKLNNKEIEKPDVIFLDVNMPVMNGWQCLSLLKDKEAFRDIPVIMYSTSARTEEIDKAYQLGALCFFAKPHNFSTLEKSLEIVISHLNNHSLSSLTLSSPLFLVP